VCRGDTHDQSAFFNVFGRLAGAIGLDSFPFPVAHYWESDLEPLLRSLLGVSGEEEQWFGWIAGG
jgi:hypothetical protein